MGESSSKVKVEISSRPEEDEFWLSFGQSLISEAINILDNRARFMVTTSASLVTADFAIILITSKVTLLTISPQFFFAFSTLFFILSLIPRRYQVNPWLPDETKHTYIEIMNAKHRWHKIGFSLLFLGLLLVALSSLAFSMT